MPLSTVLNSARSSLSAISERTRAVSENIANVDNPDHSRRIARNISAEHGVLRVSVSRAQDAEILSRLLEYTARHAASSARAEGLDRLGLIYGDADSDISPAALVNRLQADLQSFASMPDSATAAARAVGTARDLVAAINRGAETVAALRREADAEVERSVARINDLLAQFHEANAAIVTGRLSDAELVRNQDARDRALMALAEELDIRTVNQSDGGLAIYTTAGAVLYERGAREVRFEPAAGGLLPGAPGGRVIIDNVPVTGDAAIMGITSGRLAGLVELRDGLTAGWEVQLDELARGLIEGFAESDPSGTLPDAPGLFTWPGAPALPPAGVHQPGLARALALAPQADPQAGGDAFLLRDGGIAGAAYVANGSGIAGFTDRLLQLSSALDAPRAFDAAAGLSASASLKDFAARSSGWLQEQRAIATRDADYASALLTRTSDALSRATGVDLDEELTVMMQLERSYQATARVLTTVDNMLAALMQSMR